MSPNSQLAHGNEPGVLEHGRLPAGDEHIGLLGSSQELRRAMAIVARLARVDVEVESKHDLATWLTPGRHWGLLLKGARLSVR